MNKHVLFIQGGGDGGYEADTRLVTSLQTLLGATYVLNYPRMSSDEALPDFGWLQQIGNQITVIDFEVILVGHSLGASMLLKYLSANDIKIKVAGVFLISTPFWSGAEDWKQGLKLQKDFAEKLPQDVSIFFYHCRDDEVVPFGQFNLYRQQVPWATFIEIGSGGHQLNNDMTEVAKDIKSL